MLHITTQLLSANIQHNNLSHAAVQEKSEESRKRRRLKSPPVILDLGSLSAGSDASFLSSRVPHARRFNVFPMATPVSTTSAIFDSPQKSSPSSSVSSTTPLTLVLRNSTPLAELEDTSLTYTCPELEDTSNHAVCSHGSRNISSFTIKSTNPTARSIVGAVDQQLSDYEAEIHFLRRSLAEAEKSLHTLSKSLYETKEAANDSNIALDAAQETISDREYEIEIKNNVIVGLEKDVKHCQEHHPPPTPPSKSRGSEGAVSRFNTDANCSLKSLDSKGNASVISPPPVGRRFAAAPKPMASPPKTPRSTFRAASASNTPSPCVGDSSITPSNHHSQSPRSGACKLVTIETLATALSSAASPSRVIIQPTDCPSSVATHARIRNLEQLLKIEKKRSTEPATLKSQHRSHPAMQSSASSPNLRDAQNLVYRSDAVNPPPALPIMSGGLGIFEGSLSESQEHKLRKKRGGLGDLFRRKDLGVTIGGGIVTSVPA